MSDAKRIDPEKAREKVTSDDDALLVCAYDDEEKCRENALEGALTYEEFLQKRDDVPRDAAIIFY